MSSPILTTTLEIERHVAADGWNQQPRLFALADTATLIEREPQLARSMGLMAGPGLSGSFESDFGPASEFTPIEQNWSPDNAALEEALVALAWPPEVVGCAVVVERLILPPSAEADLPDAFLAAEHEVALAAAAHPDRKEVRLVAVVTSDGERMCAVRIRGMGDTDIAGAPEETDVLTGPDLVPNLIDALAATFAPDDEDHSES